MRLLIAAGPFKESLSADDVCIEIARAARLTHPDITVVTLPLSDGGTGLLKRCRDALGGEMISAMVHDAAFRPLGAEYLMVDRTAIVESSQAAGLALVPPSLRNPFLATTFGVGELAFDAIKKRADRIVVGCGDSATNDGGVGFAQALGVDFFDSGGNLLEPGKSDLRQIASIQMSRVPEAVREVNFECVCNMTSLFGGPSGTTMRFATQKGATNEDLPALASGMEKIADLFATVRGQEFRTFPGTGGSGGLSGGIYALFSGKLTYSMDFIARILDIEERVKDADFVITSEGMIDAKTANGKAPVALALIAKRHDKPVAALVGAIGDDADIVYYHGIDLIQCIHSRPVTLPQALNVSYAKVELFHTACRLMRSIHRLKPRLREPSRA